MWQIVLTNPNFAGAMASIALIAGVVIWHALNTARKRDADRMEAELKLEMVSRGMRAEDIERVLGAKMDGNQKLMETTPHGV